MIGSTKKRLVGLDIDTGEVRAVELSGTISSPRLAAWGSEALPEGAVEDGIIQEPSRVAEALRRLWGRSGFKGKDVILGVSNQEVLVRFVTFPKVPEDKLDGLIKYQAQEYLPLPLASVIMDYTVIGETKGESGDLYEVILVAARREMLEAYLATLEEAGFNPWDIDVSSLVLRKIAPLKEDEVILLVDIANGQTNILLLARGVPRLARRVPVRLKDAASLLKVTVEDLLQKPELNEHPSPPYLGWLDSLAGEIRSSISYYQSQGDVPPVEEILLSGKGARAPRVAARIEELLNIPVGNIHSAGSISNSRQMSHEEEQEFSIAISLALRGLEE